MARSLAAPLGFGRLVFGLLVLCGRPAWAQDGEERVVPAEAASASSTGGAHAQHHLDEGLARYRELDYDACIEAMTRATNTADVTDPQRLVAYEYIAMSYLVLDRLPEAELALGRLFAIDPYYVLREPSGSPKIQRLVAQIRERLVPDARLDANVELHLELPTEFQQAEAEVITATVMTGGASQVAATGSITVHYRTNEDAEWSSQRLVLGDESFRGEITVRGSGEVVELYAEARDLQGRVVTRQGTVVEPLTVPLRPAPEPPDPAARRRKIWWVVAVLGVLAAGAAVAVGVATFDSRVEPGTLPPGRVALD